MFKKFLVSFMTVVVIGGVGLVTTTTVQASNVEGFNRSVESLSGYGHIQQLRDVNVELLDGDIYHVGTAGQSLRLEGINLNTSLGSLRYRTFIQDQQWLPWVNEGTFSGTRSQSLRMESVQLEYSHPTYKMEYRVHLQTTGWTAWHQSGEIAGTTGQSRRLEAIQIRFVSTEPPKVIWEGSMMWVTRPDDNVDLTGKSSIEVDRDYVDRHGRSEINLLLKGEDNNPLDLTNYEIIFSNEGVLGNSTTTSEWQERGHIHLPILDNGETKLSLQNKDTLEVKELITIVVVPEV